MLIYNYSVPLNYMKWTALQPSHIGSGSLSFRFAPLRPNLAAAVLVVMLPGSHLGC